MHSKKEFYSDYFKRLKSLRLSVNETELPDIMAEIYNGNNELIGVITSDDRLICETSDTAVIEKMFDTAKQSAQAVGACTELPHTPTPTNENINGYFKLYEVGEVVLACKDTPLFGYEFATFKKSTDYATNKTIYYYAQLYYNYWFAQQEFAKRARLIDGEVKITDENQATFTQSELSLLLTCCLEKIKLDDFGNTATEKALGTLVDKIEGMLPDIDGYGNILDTLYMER